MSEPEFNVVKLHQRVAELEAVVEKLKAGIRNADDEYWDQLCKHADQYTTVLTKRAVDAMESIGITCPDANEPDVTNAIVTLLRLSLHRYEHPMKAASKEEVGA